jgi:histone-lysine N-methyltransferase SETMAR
MPRSRPWVIVSTLKVMVSIFWSPVNFPVITALPSKSKFSSAYFCDKIIPKIVDGMPFDLAKSPRKLILHIDDTSPHRARASCEYLKKFRRRRIRHPPYSRDLAPSDFYLLRTLK